MYQQGASRYLLVPVVEGVQQVMLRGSLVGRCRSPALIRHAPPGRGCFSAEGSLALCKVLSRTQAGILYVSQ